MYFIRIYVYIKKTYSTISAMEISDIFNILHNAIESQQNGKKISQKDMAKVLGVSMRTYQDWKIGNSKPQVAAVIMQMLGSLDDDEIVRVVRKINKIKAKN